MFYTLILMVHKYILTFLMIFTILVAPLTLFGGAQEQTAPEVAILESRFSTTEPIIGETLTYFLKFNYKDGVNVSPVEHFAENGFTVIEKKSLEPQKFQGRVIQQYDYTLRAEQEGGLI